MLSTGRRASCFFFKGSGAHRDLPSFPTRRSPDLRERVLDLVRQAAGQRAQLREPLGLARAALQPLHPAVEGEDRKSTRLNSSHANISYAVFCLKKKKHLTYMTSCKIRKSHETN